MRRRVLGEEHPDTLVSTYEIGQLFQSQGRTAQAETLFSKVLEARRRILGPEHPDTLVAMSSVAEIWLQQEKHTEAELLLRETMNARQKATPDAWERYKVESLLGAVLIEQRKYGAAEPLLLSGYQGLIQRQEAIPAAERFLLRQTRDRIVQQSKTGANQTRPPNGVRFRADNPSLDNSSAFPPKQSSNSVL